MSASLLEQGAGEGEERLKRECETNSEESRTSVGEKRERDAMKIELIRTPPG